MIWKKSLEIYYYYRLQLLQMFISLVFRKEINVTSLSNTSFIIKTQLY